MELDSKAFELLEENFGILELDLEPFKTETEVFGFKEAFKLDEGAFAGLELAVEAFKLGTATVDLVRTEVSIDTVFDFGNNNRMKEKIFEIIVSNKEKVESNKERIEFKDADLRVDELFWTIFEVLEPIDRFFSIIKLKTSSVEFEISSENDVDSSDFG